MSTETAIQEKDVVEQAEEPKEESAKPQLERDSLMAKIAGQRRKQLAEELGDLPNKQSEQEEEPEGEDEETLSDEPEMVDLKVDGEIIQKPREEVDAEGGVAAMQKKIAAETRLAQAAEERKSLARKEKELKEFENRLKAMAQEVNQKSQPKGVTVEQVATARKAYTEAIYSGDEDQIADALEKYENLRDEHITQKFAPKPQKEVDTRAIAATVKKEVAFETSINEGKKVLNEKYSHLTQDPHLYRMTDQATVRLQKDNPDWEPKKVIVEAAKEVNEWLDKYRPQQADLIEERKNKKKKLDNIPTASTKQPKAEGPKAKTPEEIFNEMRKGRSQ